MTLYNKQFGDIVKAVREMSVSPQMTNISIISNVTLEPVFEESLKYVMNEELSIQANIILESYDELFSSNREVTLNSDWTLLIHDFSECLSSYESREEIKERDLERINVTINNIRKNNDKPILVTLPESTSYPLDDKIVSEIRNSMMSIPHNVSKCYLVDMNKAVMKVGEGQFYDYRKQFAFNLPYSTEGSLALARIFCDIIRDTLGKYKKCLVLDCDNVLWGGVLEEVGMNGIKLDTTFPGNQYLHFQKELIKLHQCGVILTLCSKNNEDEVLEVIRTHPFMVIKEEHVAAYRINWNNKVDNIKQISDELNISLSDMVFVDDSEFEIGIVSESLPEVTTIHLPVKRPYEYSVHIKNCGFFKTSNLTGDDLLRNSTYQNERKRKKEREKYFNYEEYLNSLEIKLASSEVTQFTASRISQLSYRTNRCNLSCKKISTEEVIYYSQQPDYWVRCFELSDKFGDYGFVGAMIINITDDSLIIEGFYLSCRALGKNVEKMMLDYLLSNLELKDRELTYIYKDNGKNHDVEVFIKEYIEGLKLATN